MASGHWIGVPQFIISWAITYREDWLQGAGAQVPRHLGRVPDGRAGAQGQGPSRFGQAFGHSINDPNNWCYPLVWMWGGMEVDEDGSTVVIDTKAVVEAVKFNNVLWKECSTRAASGWDDSNNNRAFLASEHPR